MIKSTGLSSAVSTLSGFLELCSSSAVAESLTGVSGTCHIQRWPAFVLYNWRLTILGGSKPSSSSGYRSSLLPDIHRMICPKGASLIVSSIVSKILLSGKERLCCQSLQDKFMADLNTHKYNFSLVPSCFNPEGMCRSSHNQVC